MKKVFLFFVSMACMLALAPAAKADGGRDKIAALLETMRKSNSVVPQEKVYLHLDNTGYFMGETIWFKAYMIRSDNGRLGSVSRVLYVDLVNPSGDVVATRKLKVENGQANGEFTLTEKMMSGFFTVRAYTRYMLNWGTAAIFSRVVPIFKQPVAAGDYSHKILEENTLKAMLPQQKAAAETENTHKVNVRFYPEGGSLVRGLQSRVAFELCDEQGAPLEAEGNVVSDGKTVASATTLREGRGTFLYTPSGKGSLELTLKGGGKKTFDLPASLSEGCVMRVDATDGAMVRSSVTASQGYKGRTLGQVFLHNGSLVRCNMLTLTGTTATNATPRDSLPAGVNQVVLLDESGRVLADRLVFVYPRHGVGTIGVGFTDTVTWPCKRMTMDVEAAPNATLSVAVNDAATLTGGYAHNAATWLLLTSDLRGYINHPEYYLEGDDAEHRAAADLLMLVQGWRRYDASVMDGKDVFKLKYMPEDSLYLYGQLHAKKEKYSVDNVDLDVLLKDAMGDELRGKTVTDKSGYYAFALPDCYRNWNLSMETRKDNKPENYYIGIDRQFAPEAEATSFYATQPDDAVLPTWSFALAPQYAEVLPEALKNHWLETVVVTGKRQWRSPRATWESENVGEKNASLRYDCQKAAEAIADRGEADPSFLKWLETANSNIKGNDNISGTFRHGTAWNNFHDDGPQYINYPIVWIVNNNFFAITGYAKRGNNTTGVEDYDGNGNYYFPTMLSDVKSVYVSFDRRELQRFLIAPSLDGINLVTVFVYSYGQDNLKVKGLRQTHFDGYAVPQEYEQMMDMSHATVESDYRRTLYWNPNVRTDGRGRAVLTFTNNSTGRTVAVSTEGFTADGKPMIMENTENNGK